MATSPNTKSTSTTETVRGDHRFEIAGYSHKQGAGAGNVLTSGTFAAGGFDWAIRFYPDGKDIEGFVSVFVRLVTPNAATRALFDLRLVDRATGQPRSVRRSREPAAFDADNAKKRERGARAFMARGELAASPYLRGDRLTVECVLDVVQDTRLSPATACPEILDPPPPDLREHLVALLRAQVGADVTFSVHGEAFRAHRVVLAARSPVFKAELSSSPPAKENDSTGETTMPIDGMAPLVFKTLLHFIYTDALPDLDDDLGMEEYQELVWNLLAAADRYAMDRLKQICRVIMQEALDAKTVAAALDATGRSRHCQALGDGCVQFLPSSGLEG